MHCQRNINHVQPCRRPKRFGELRRMLPGITQHMLTEQLRNLARNGILIRNALAEIVSPDVV